MGNRKQDRMHTENKKQNGKYKANYVNNSIGYKWI